MENSIPFLKLHIKTTLILIISNHRPPPPYFASQVSSIQYSFQWNDKILTRKELCQKFEMDFNIFTISEVFPLIHNLLLSRPRREFRIRIYQYFYIEWREGGREGGYQSKQTSPNNSIYIYSSTPYQCPCREEKIL